MKTLMEIAKEHRPQTNSSLKIITDEQIDLAIAWMKDELRPVQVAAALGFKLEAGNYQRILAGLIREGYRRGKIKVA